MVENFNKVLAQRLFKHQQRIELETGKPDSHWVKNLQPEIKLIKSNQHSHSDDQIETNR